MKKENKKTAIFYNEIEHSQEMRKAYELVVVFDEAKKELETILEKPIEDYVAFKKDVLAYSLKEIKLKYPRAFELGIPTETTLNMLNLNLRSIREAEAVLRNNPCKFDVCPKTGKANASEDKEPYIWYATTDEQHARLDFANELIEVLNKAHAFTPYVHKANMTTGVNRIVVFDGATEKIIPHPYFIMEGVKN